MWVGMTAPEGVHWRERDGKEDEGEISDKKPGLACTRGDFSLVRLIDCR